METLTKTLPNGEKIAVRYDPMAAGKVEEMAKKELQREYEKAIGVDHTLESLEEKYESECPHCVTSKEPKKEIEWESWSGLLSGGIEKKERFKCRDCGNQFNRQELKRHRKTCLRKITEHKKRKKKS